MEDYRTRRKEQAKQTEQAILQAAMDLSRKQSFDKVSIREICQQAGITTGAFYHHFRSKEDLLSRGFAPLDTYLEQCLAGHEDDPPALRLRRILTNYAGFLENLGWELVARYYQRRLDAPDDTSSMDSSRFTLRAMAGCLAQAEAEGGLLPGWSAEWTADFLLRHFRGVVIDWTLHRGSYQLLSKLEQDYTLFSHVFRTG
ncbi:TetR/AcrR family transcriptional regulator [uncultured Flavonifractor sp.]|uniref:TetR/AcrR family transcriptional regulator n=1 Tax=Candidatus Flavonifractor intestinigallinarum TaxID=2838586 RepID=A0A9D2MN71_9FIRM|nr:TetR/AcrR family transcriptional regulator [uncultured Flavonifractor sp.]HJB81222.1 TetR/AcrR family transcriptional regulator [Candidatus Flavonifractor intestinigallinarum]